VDDVVCAMVAAATAPNVNGLVINVGSGVETSLRGLTKLIFDVTGSQANVVYNAQTSGGVSRLCADLSLAEQKLNYKPAMTLEEGLRLTLQRDLRYKGTKDLAPRKTN
jgi:nucleoside-diphosphate-sugar epimerase